MGDLTRFEREPVGRWPDHPLGVDREQYVPSSIVDVRLRGRFPTAGDQLIEHIGQTGGFHSRQGFAGLFLAALPGLPSELNLFHIWRWLIKTHVWILLTVCASLGKIRAQTNHRQHEPYAQQRKSTGDVSIEYNRRNQAADDDQPVNNPVGASIQ